MKRQQSQKGGFVKTDAQYECVPVIIFTDLGTDLDDEMALLFARYLIEFDFIELLCVITCLHPSFKRAQLARGSLDMIGLHFVPVGSDYSYMPSQCSERAFSIETGRTLLYRKLVAAPSKSVTVIIISSMKDCAIFLRDNEALFVDRVKEVSIMGGVKSSALEPGALLQPDTAHNNQFDAPAAAWFYRRLQEVGVPMVITGRHCAYEVPVPRSVYEDLALTGSPIGWRLRNSQRSTIEQLWVRAASDDPEIRRGLPMRCDARWFKATFCGNNPLVDTRTWSDPIWDLVISFNMYDTLALLAAVRVLRDQLFKPILVKVRRSRLPPAPHSTKNLGKMNAPGRVGEDVTHQLIGVSTDTHGFASDHAKSECQNFFGQAFKMGLSLDHHQKSQIILTMQVQPNKSDEFMGLALLRALIELQAVDLLGIVVSPFRRFGEVEPLEQAAAETKATLAALGLHATEVLVQHASKHLCQLEELYKKAPQTGVRLVVIHSQTDVADFVSRSPQLFREKTLSAVCMGGVNALKCDTDFGPYTQDTELSVDTERLTADLSASNNAADAEAAIFFTEKCQQLGVPLCVVSRHLALACRLPRAVYDALHTYGGPVGRRVSEAQRESTEGLWRQVKLPPDDPRRLPRLARRCNPQWFIETFCDAASPPDSSVENIWPFVESFNVYTPHALLAAVPRIGQHFFQEFEVNVNSVKHHVIGRTKEDTGTKDVGALRLFLCRLIFKGVIMNSSFFDNTPGPTIDIEHIGTVDLSDEVPDYIDLQHEVSKRKQESLSSTMIARVMNLNGDSEA